jgi:hypothetical protein
VVNVADVDALPAGAQQPRVRIGILIIVDLLVAYSNSYDDIVDHCCCAWNTLVDQHWKFMSIARREWAIIGQSL